MADIRKELNQIKNAVYGREVRGSIHDGIDKVNRESEGSRQIANNTEQRQDAVEQQFNTLLGEWSDDKPIDNAETIAARTNTKESKTYENLGKRLDEEYDKVTEQLADTALNVKLFGATGDGSEQSAEIQAAVNSIRLVGGTVLIPSGEYLIKDTILLPDNVVLSGINDKTVLKLTPGQSRPIIANASPENGNKNIRIESLKLDGNRKNQTSDGNLPYPWAGLILFRNVKASTIRDVTCTSSFRYCVNIASTLFPDPNFEKASEDILVTGVNCSDFGDDGVTIHQSRRIVISDSFFHDSVSLEDGSPSGNSNGIEADDGCGDITISNCISYNCDNGYQIKGHSDRSAARKVLLSNCLALNSKKEGIAIRQTGDQLDQSSDVILSDCIVENSKSHGVWIHDYDYVNMSNVIIRNSGGNGLWLEKVDKSIFSNLNIENAEFGMRIDNSNDNVFSNILISKIGYHGVQLRVGSSLNKLNNINVISPNMQSGPIYGGIQITQESNYNDIRNCTVRKGKGLPVSGIIINDVDCLNNILFANELSDFSFEDQINDGGTDTLYPYIRSTRDSKSDTGSITTELTRQVNASTNVIASGYRSQVNASSGDSEASGERSQVNASGKRSLASGPSSQVNTSSNSIANKSNTSIFSSQNVVIDTSYTTAGGYSPETSEAPSTKNLKWALKSISGNFNHAGTLNSGHDFADFAEMFPNLTGTEQGMGLLQTLEGYGVRPAQENEPIIGVTSATAGIVLGDTPFSWQGRWLKDEFGAYIYEDVYDEELEECVKVPKENPNYEPKEDFASRQDRPDEWTVVGLVGQVYVRVTEDVRTMNYIKAHSHGVGTTSEEPTNIQVMQITTPFDVNKGYAVAYCLIK